MDKLQKEELEDMYWGKGMSQLEIGEMFDVSPRTISKRMNKLGIKSRTESEAKLKNAAKLSKEELEDMYCIKAMSSHKIGNKIGVSSVTICNWMKEFGLMRRTRSELVGENTSQWKGGMSFEPYCKKFNNKFKESIRGRDDYTCQLCGYKQKPDGQKLDVHHIHYKKEDCYPDCVSLCRSCHSIVGSNRNYWEQYFEDLLIEHGHFCWSIDRIGDDAS